MHWFVIIAVHVTLDKKVLISHRSKAENERKKQLKMKTKLMSACRQVDIVDVRLDRPNKCIGDECGRRLMCRC